jgi:hypothetical protein
MQSWLDGVLLKRPLYSVPNAGLGMLLCSGYERLKKRQALLFAERIDLLQDPIPAH